MRLRYTGTNRITLLSLGVEVEHGDVIDPAGPVGAAFAGRPDFERLDAPVVESPVEAERFEVGAEQAAPGRRKTKAANADEVQGIDETAHGA